MAELEKKHAGAFQRRPDADAAAAGAGLAGAARAGAGGVVSSRSTSPGRECAFDFTHGKELGVTIRGELFEHLLFELVLSFSGWTWACLAFAETFEALSMGSAGGAVGAGGCPEVARSDNLSAATHELKRTGGGR